MRVPLCHSSGLLRYRFDFHCTHFLPVEMLLLSVKKEHEVLMFGHSIQQVGRDDITSC